MILQIQDGPFGSFVLPRDCTDNTVAFLGVAVGGASFITSYLSCGLD